MTNFSTGQKVRFTGYTELEPGQAEVLITGQAYNIIAVNPDGGLQVADGDGNGDTVFPEEVELVETKASKTTAAKKAKTTKAPAKATPAKAPAKKAPAKRKTKGEASDGDTAEQETATIIPIRPIAPVALSPVITDSEAVTKLLETSDMLSAAKELAVSAEQTFLSLGGVLAHIAETGAHKTLGFDGKRGFLDYMEKELNIQYRKGRYLIEIYQTTRKLNLDESLIAQIGWSKMKEISSKLADIDASEVQSLLEYARDNTREELVAHVRKTLVRANDEDQNERVVKTRLSFSLFGDQTETVERALAAARQQIGDNSTPEMALTLITAEWSQVTEAVEFSLEAALKTLELRHGVKLGIVAETQPDENVQTVELEVV